MKSSFSIAAVAIAASLSSNVLAAAEETLLVTGSEARHSPAVSDAALLAAGTGSRLGLSDKEIPRHTETISQNNIITMGKRTLTEVVESAPGMSGATSPTLSNSVSLRGFTPVSWLYDGVTVPGSTLQGGDPVHYQSIDVLYGTGSVINGLSSAGGSINLIPRQASFGPHPIELDYGWSSFASHRVHVGTGGTLVDKLAAGRLDVSASSTGSQVEGERQRPQRMTGSLLLTPTDNTMLTFNIDRMMSDTHNPYFGTPLIDGKTKKRLRHTNFNNLEDAWIRSQATSIQATQSWFASSELTFENKLYYYSGFREWHNAERYYPAASRPGYITRDSFGDIAHDDKLTGNRTTVTLDKPVGGLDNRVIAGMDLSQREFAYYSNGFAGEDSVPVINSPKTPFSSGNAPRRALTRQVTQNQYALFVEDKLNMTDAIAVLAQARYSNLEMKWNFRQQNQADYRSYDFITLAVGPTWDITDDITVYANYATGKEPGNDIFFISPAQTSLPLTNVQQYEAGVKGTFWHQRGEVKLAVYDLQKKNLYQQDALQTDIWNAVGKQTSRGVELSGSIQPWDSLTLAGNAAYTHARFDAYQQGGQDLAGNTPRYVPQWTANLSARYRATQQLGLGAQLHYVGSSYNNDTNSDRMAGYTTIDLSADYEVLPGMTLGTRVRNLTDRFYSWQRTYATQELIAPGRTYEAFVNIRI
ncbi:TonB-dependent siderophore receptor [Biostraticola tofi]|uniref:Iron complex outermembrane receptor protein n=1 Tax=Biostraticola tofi TaxID=466109 RepID=A0A4R3YW33_9GAMM|nr:TonB-dependent receptor [Biostraticola tofi]TCV96800.1 iron complex outermembrane receptor protein [Biostraticola tofi]